MATSAAGPRRRPPYPTAGSSSTPPRPTRHMIEGGLTTLARGPRSTGAPGTRMAGPSGVRRDRTARALGRVRTPELRDRCNPLMDRASRAAGAGTGAVRSVCWVTRAGQHHRTTSADCVTDSRRVPSRPGADLGWCSCSTQTITNDRLERPRVIHARRTARMSSGRGARGPRPRWWRSARRRALRHRGRVMNRPSTALMRGPDHPAGEPRGQPRRGVRRDVSRRAVTGWRGSGCGRWVDRVSHRGRNTP